MGLSRYFMTPMEKYSGWSFLWFTNRKYEAGDAVVEMVSELENFRSARTGTLKCFDRKSVKWL